MKDWHDVYNVVTADDSHYLSVSRLTNLLFEMIKRIEKLEEFVADSKGEQK